MIGCPTIPSEYWNPVPLRVRNNRNRPHHPQIREHNFKAWRQWKKGRSGGKTVEVKSQHLWWVCRDTDIKVPLNPGCPFPFPCRSSARQFFYLSLGVRPSSGPPWTWKATLLRPATIRCDQGPKHWNTYISWWLEQSRWCSCQCVQRSPWWTRLRYP